MTDVHKFLADLESKADAATSGPWVTDGLDVHDDANDMLICECYADNIISADQKEANADFIAAANPEAVKRLVGMVRLAIGSLERIRDKSAWCCNECNPCRPECVARQVLDALKNSGEK